MKLGPAIFVRHRRLALLLSMIALAGCQAPAKRPSTGVDYRGDQAARMTERDAREALDRRPDSAFPAAERRATPDRQRELIDTPLRR